MLKSEEYKRVILNFDTWRQREILFENLPDHSQPSLIS